MIRSRTNAQRSLIALVQILGLSVWFSATAAVPRLRSDWGFGPTAAGWLTASVQIGFATGAVTSALLNLADRVKPQYLLAASAACAAACTAALAFFVHGVSAAIALRFLTGVVLAGVYPVGMKLMASWSESSRSGALVRSPDRGAGPRLSGPPPDQWPRAAALEDCDDHRRGIVRRRGLHRLRGHRARATPGPAGDHPEPPLRGRHVRRTRPPAHQCGLLRPHVGAVRPMDLALGVRAGGSAGTRPCGRYVDRRHRVQRDRDRRPRRITAWRMGIGPLRSSPCSGDRAGDQRSLLHRLPVVLRRADCGFGPVLGRVGRLGHRRLRCLLHLAERDGGQTARRDGTDRADGDRLPAHRRDDPPRPRSRGPGRLAVRLPAARTWSGDRRRRDGSASWVPDIHYRT